MCDVTGCVNGPAQGETKVVINVCRRYHGAFIKLFIERLMRTGVGGGVGGGIT